MANSNKQPIFSDRNVYILGAGFSREAGFPLIADFTYRMRDALEWFELQSNKAEADAIRAVLDFRRRAAPAVERVPLNLENIEEVFSLAAATTDPSLNRSAALAIAATLDYARVCAPPVEGRLHAARGFGPVPGDWKHQGKVGMRDGSEGVGYACPLYDIYALVLAGLPDERAAGRRDTIISFNYDTLVEDGLARLKIPFSYGFDRELPQFDASARCITQAASEEPAVFRVLKLHGSVNWAVPDNGQLTVFGSYEDVRSKSLSPLLIPPTWRKDPSAQLSDVWDQAVLALRTATRVAIIGYSIPPTDQHFKYLLAAGLQDNISLRKIFFFNPAANGLRQNLANVLRPDLTDLPPRLVELIDQGTYDVLMAPRYRQILNREPVPSGRWTA